MAANLFVKLVKYNVHGNDIRIERVDSR